METTIKNQMLYTIKALTLFTILFSLGPAIHEAGHFLAALLTGITPTAFSIGAGDGNPTLLSFSVYNISFILKALPLVSFVNIPDLNWIVCLAGPVTSIIISVIASFCAFRLYKTGNSIWKVVAVIVFLWMFGTYNCLDITNPMSDGAKALALFPR